MKFKRLIPALCMLLVSACVLGTSTYAWFSMNTTVTATGMTIEAKSDNTWLVINEGSTFDADGVATTATSTGSATQLLPMAPVSTITSANVLTPGSWQHGYSDTTNDATINSDGYITNTTLTDYIASETFSIGLSNKSGATSASNLKVTSVTLPANTGISVVVVCGSNAYTYRATVAALTGQTLATSVTTSGVTVTVYYFIDGDNTNVYTDNIDNVTGTVSLTFGVD